MSPLTEALLPQLKSRFKNQAVSLLPAPNVVATFRSSHPAVGEVHVYDDGDEFTVALGPCTHTHFTCYGDVNADDKARAEVVSEVVSFLEDLFADRIAFYGSHEAGGGWWYRDSDGVEEDGVGSGNVYLWSGPIEA